MWFCSIFGAVLRKFFFNLQYCGYTKPSSLQYLHVENFEQFQWGLQFSYVILCCVYNVFLCSFAVFIPPYTPLNQCLKAVVTEE